MHNHSAIRFWCLENKTDEKRVFSPSFLLPDPLFSSFSSSCSSSTALSPNGIQCSLAAISSHSHCTITQLTDRPGSLWSPCIFKRPCYDFKKVGKGRTPWSFIFIHDHVTKHINCIHICRRPDVIWIYS